MAASRKFKLPTVQHEPLPSPSAIEAAAVRLGAPDAVFTVRALTEAVCDDTGVHVTDRQRLHVATQLKAWRDQGHAIEHGRTHVPKGSVGGRPAMRWQVLAPILD